MLSIVFGLFGLIIGSFLNVLIVRWGERTLGGRSACMTCGRQIAWYDLIPVVSWFALKGRCRACGSRISIQYPLVEAATAAAFAFIGASPLPLAFQLAALPIAALLIGIAVYDFFHTVIPDAWVYACAALSFGTAVAGAWGTSDPYAFALTLLSGPFVALPLFLLWWVSRGRWMGFGDVKLALSMGWLLGTEWGLGALLFAFILGASVSVPLLFFSSPLWKQLLSGFTHTPTSEKFVYGFTMHSEIPFGPFLIASCFFVWFMHIYGVPIPYLLP